MGRPRNFICKEKIVSESLSTINKGQRRFEIKTIGNVEYIRAQYGHSFPLNGVGYNYPLADGLEYGRIPSLLEYALHSVVKNIKRFPPDMNLGQYIPDAYLLQLIFETLKLEYSSASTATTSTSSPPPVTCSISNPLIKLFLIPEMEVLNLQGILVSNSLLKLIGINCNKLVTLNLRGCFTDMTDTNFQFLLRKIAASSGGKAKLQNLDIGDCKNITDKGLEQIGKFCCPSSLKSLTLCGLPLISEDGVWKEIILKLCYCCSSNSGKSNEEKIEKDGRGGEELEGGEGEEGLLYLDISNCAQIDKQRIRNTCPNLKIK